MRRIKLCGTAATYAESHIPAYHDAIHTKSTIEILILHAAAHEASIDFFITGHDELEMHEFKIASIQSFIMADHHLQIQKVPAVKT